MRPFDFGGTDLGRCLRPLFVENEFKVCVPGPITNGTLTGLVRGTCCRSDFVVVHCWIGWAVLWFSKNCRFCAPKSKCEWGI